MSRKRKFIFLPVALAAILLLGACGGHNPSPDPQPEPEPEQPADKFAISFNANGGTGTMANVPDVSGEYTLPANGFTAPEGKHFAGWKVNNQGEALEAGAKINVTADVELFATWEVTTYAVSFAANGGSGEMANVTGVVGEYTLPENAFTAPEGKHFAGWKINGEGETLAVGAKITVAANTQLEAQWVTTVYTVTFNANGGTGEMAAVPEVVGDYELPSSTFTAPEGKHFAGWKVNDAGEALQPGANYVVGADVELFAQWEITTYTVSFNANGGTGEMADVPEIVGEYTLPAATFQAPEGKHFAGWKIANDGETKEAGATVDVATNVELYAQWAVNMYTVTFKNGEEVVDTQEVAYGETATYGGETPTKAADAEACKYRFIGWDLDLTQPVVADAVANAQFAAYAEEVVVDDFEGYEESSEMIENGWVAIGYNNDTQKWTTDTKAAVSLGSKSVEGAQSLRFDAWRNGVTYGIRKPLQGFDKIANTLKFRLMTPRGMKLTIALNANAVISGQLTDVQFKYVINPVASGEYVEYTIPLNDANWAAWGEQGKTIAVLAGALGLSEDDILKTVTKMEFYLSGMDAGKNGTPYIAFIDSVKFVTLDNPQRSDFETMGQYTKYTGISASGNTIKIELGANGAATATVLDLPTPMEIPGAISMNGKQITFTSSDSGATLVYTGNMINGSQAIEFVSADGALKSSVGQMGFTAVQTVDNFDQYEKDGTSWYQSNTINDRDGARGAYYSEYYAGSGKTEWGGNGWSLMGGDGSQLKLKMDGGHSGKNYLCLKNSSGSAMRYMQWGIYDGSSEQNAYRGSKLSFWAKTNGRVPEFKVYMYSQTAPKNATKDQYVKTAVIRNNAALSTWTHYEVDLNPDLVYYGFVFFMEKNGGADSYLYIDDVEVYTGNPYAKYVEPENMTLTPGHQYEGLINGLIRAELTVISDTQIELSAHGIPMMVSGTYTISGNEVTMSLDGGVTYKVTLSADGNKMTFKSVSGDGVVAGALNGLNLARIVMLENCEQYETSGKMYYQGNKDESQISGARGAYYCDYYTDDKNTSSPVGGAKWNLMGGSGDQLNLENETSADGSKSLKLKASTVGMRYCQWNHYKGNTTYNVGYSKLVIHMKNSSETEDISVKVYAFKRYKLTSSSVGERSEAEITVKAGQDWAAYSVDLDSSVAYYGYGVFINAGKSVRYLYVDRVYLCTNTTNADNDFYGKKDLTMNGELNDGVAASLKFGDFGKIKVTCAALQLSEAEVDYKISMSGAHQYLTFTIGSGEAATTIKGEYAVNIQGVATFTVKEATGAMAAQVKIGNVFSSAS